MIKLFVKARATNPGVAMPVGTVTTWADGTVHKKISQHKWSAVSVGSAPARTKATVKAENYYNDAVGMSWAGLGIVEHLEDKFKITDFAGLKRLISGGPKDQASKIFRSTKDHVDSLSIPTGNKAAAIDRLGRSLLALRDIHAGPKKKLTIRVRAKRSGKVRWSYKKAPQVSFSASKIKTAQKRLGGWSDMSKMPTMKQLRTMEKNGTAKIVWGKPVGKRKWGVYQEAKDTVIPFKENAKGIKVKMRQFEIKKKRTLRTATVKLTMPYPFARQFLEHNIKSARTRNDLVGQLTRSAGYKKAAK